MRLIDKLFLVFSCLLATPVFGDTAADTIKINAAWVRSVPPVTSTTAGYMQLTNQGAQEQLLVAASSDAAGIIELHSNTSSDGMMRMRRIAHVHLPAGQTISLDPGAMHLMIFRLKQALIKGEAVKLVLEFADGSHKTVMAEVK